MLINVVGSNFDPYYNANEVEIMDPTSQKLYDMLDIANVPLCLGCIKRTQLSSIARLLNIKSKFHMPEKYIEKVLPYNDKLVNCFYTKNFIVELGLPCEKIYCYIWMHVI